MVGFSMINTNRTNILNNLVLIGGGGHCRSVIDSVYSSYSYSKIVITDPNLTTGTNIFGCKVVGGDEALSELFSEGYDSAFIVVGSINNTILRRKIDNIIKTIGFYLPTIVDSSAVIASNCSMDEGVYIAKLSCVNSGSHIGRNAIINTGAIVEHDCHIGDYSHIAVGAVVCGGCWIENDVFVGANATVIQGIRVGKNSIIGAGCTVLADVPDNTTVTGVWKKR